MLVVLAVVARKDNCTAYPSLAVATVTTTMMTMPMGWRKMMVVVEDRDMRKVMMLVAIAEHSCSQEPYCRWEGEGRKLVGGRKRGRKEDTSCVIALGQIVPIPIPSSFVVHVDPGCCLPHILEDTLGRSSTCPTV